ncbi:TetR/AcrR family transcriptional repressor of nem operon [Rhizobium sp. BK196]|jgi:TetR/AcrR family transcriptional regulator, transcriptional repressor for nem operon|uniref:TetR/AcrR family transcriptional regulator n=1 Tax=unclassified Rhizobium TaxID=2613769 RepID=UPI00161A0A0D|nr:MULTISPECIES: TetR/AcrR family transcriptional regulator [unclassified Rhizobium]MBB3313741.1 TetR/AcrR family transcriptional repressor of nem operon [Rhizobium sp. BK196]MBB3463421.1 TetR/AcrR family transcriptional repressor of nem operon [Rhizobium sp. BK377]
MRVSREKFAENREKILTAASVLFRENGFDGVGVADIMRAAGLTHGGFYGHFESKDDLALEVSRKLIERVEERWRELIAAEPDKPLQALLDHYIHWRTVDDPGGSCVFASLIQEVSRSEGAVRATFSEGLSTLVDVLKEVVPGATEEERRANATSTLSSMMGAVILARAVEDRALAEQFLVTMRRKLDPARQS